MLYAFHDGNTTIVGAGDSMVEFDTFYGEAVKASDEGLYTNYGQPTTYDLISDERFLRYKKPPFIFEHDSKSQRDAFAKRFGLEIKKQNYVADRHRDMIDAMEDDPYFAPTPENEEDKRTLAQIHGLDQEDPWDRRSDEEKEKDEKMKKEYEQAKKEGRLSGESFGGGKGPQARVTDINTVVDRDGKVSITDVMAVKGLHDDTVKEALEAEARVRARANGEAPAEAPKEEPSKRSLGDLVAAIAGPTASEQDAEQGVEQQDDEADNEDLNVNPEGNIAIYFKVAVVGAKLADVRAKLTEEQNNLIEQMAVVKRNNAEGCWYALPRQIVADSVYDMLVKAGFDVEEVHGVSDTGERLVPKGQAQVVDKSVEEEIGPRPWNDRAPELATMTPEQLEENKKSYKGKEFIFTGHYDKLNKYSMVYITPREWFEKHGTMWDGDLDIDHILPTEMKKVEDGVYKSGADWNRLTLELENKRGMKWNGFFQIYLNNL